MSPSAPAGDGGWWAGPAIPGTDPSWGGYGAAPDGPGGDPYAPGGGPSTPGGPYAPGGGPYAPGGGPYAPGGGPYGPAGYGPPGGYGPPPGYRARHTNGFAVASLVIGILSVTFGFIFILPPILAIVFGAIALPRAQYRNGVMQGRSLAVAGVILGVVTLLGAIALYSYLGASGRIHKTNSEPYLGRPAAVVVLARSSEYPLLAPGEYR